MAATTRTRALDAAVELVGEYGVRALTHARVDERAGLPPGSTSNWFRTRRALLTGVHDWIAERERDDLDLSALPIGGVDELVEVLCIVTERQVEPHAVRTRARYALFLELAGDPELGPRLQQEHRRFRQWTEQVLTEAGIPDPATATRAVMALLDGLLLHRIVLDPDLDLRASIARTVRALAEP